MVALLLPTVPRHDQEPPGHRVPSAFDAPHPRAAPGDLGRLASYRSRLVRDFVAGTDGRLALERLPAYAPELNPVEYLWGHWKHHELPNFCPQDYAQLSEEARRALRRMRRRQKLVTAFWKQARLF